MTNIDIRSAEKEDVEELSELVQGYLAFYQRPMIEKEQIKAAIIRFIEHPEEGTQLIAVQAGRLIGFTTLNPIWSTTRMQKIALLNDLFVHPDVRKSGAGRKLMDATIQLAKDLGYPFMRLLTASDNHIAQGLYDKTGGTVPGWLVYDYDLTK